MTVTAPPEARTLEATRGLTPARRSYTVEDVEIRAADDGSTVRQFVGHASTWKPYDMYGGPDAGGWTEHVDRGAFKRTINANPDVPLLINHEGQPFAATWNGTVNLSEDSVGLRVGAEIDTSYPEAQSFVRRLETRLLREMSFAFRVKKQAWFNGDGEEVPWWDMTGTERHLTELDIHKGDVSVVNFGANDTTDAALRSLTDTLRGFTPDDLTEDEVRAAVTYLNGLLPVPVTANPDVVAESFRTARVGVELRAALLQ